MSHHLSPEPDIIRRASGLTFIDVPWGYRDARPVTPQPRLPNGRFAGRRAGEGVGR